MSHQLVQTQGSKKKQNTTKIFLLLLLPCAHGAHSDSNVSALSDPVHILLTYSVLITALDVGATVGTTYTHVCLTNCRV